MIMLEKDRLAIGKARYSLQNAAFKEEDHPRGEGGQFGKGSSTPKSFNIDPKKVKSNPIPKELKSKWAKAGGVDNPEYKKWIYEHWNSDASR